MGTGCLFQFTYCHYDKSNIPFRAPTSKANKANTSDTEAAFLDVTTLILKLSFSHF